MKPLERDSSSAESRDTARPRIGLFGGAFDPPHNAHVALVQAAVLQLGLTRLHVLPTGQAWHKPRTLSAAHHRLAMARLAFDELPGVQVDPREIERDGPTYTIDTLRELQRENAGAQMVLVIGADQAAALTTWRDWQEVARDAIISVAERDQPARTIPQFDFEKLSGARMERLQLPRMPVSATAIRAQLARAAPGDKNASSLVPAPVARYIAHHHLYQTA